MSVTGWPEGGPDSWPDNGPNSWAAPSRDEPLDADVAIPGSKSVTNRALLLGAISDGPSVLHRPLLSRDTSLMADALRALGCDLDWPGDDRAVVTPRPLRGPARIDCGLAGTVMRFVPPVAALASGPVDFDGDAQARRRPMGQMLAALRRLGVDLTAADHRLPFQVLGQGRVRGGVVTLDASASSQFVSALLLAGARYEEGVDVRHVGKPLPSLPHVAMTVAMLRERGVEVDDGDANRWQVTAGVVSAMDVTIEPDLSSAAPFLAAALVCGGRVRIPGWPSHTDQPGDQLRWILQVFGADVDLTPDGLTVSGTGSIASVDLDLHDVGELTPVLAALATLGSGTSYLRGIGHLRGHETDRLAALALEIRGLGGDCDETADGLVIRAGVPTAQLGAGLFHSHADHRMAQAGALLGLAVPGVRVDDIATTDKTFPGFADAWTAMLR